MCRNLSETAARDLENFVRKVRRTGLVKAGTDGGKAAVLASLAESAERLLAKHGLLTPADDPALAAVFMEDEPEPVECTDSRPCGTCFICTTRVGAEDDVRPVFNERAEFVVEQADLTPDGKHHRLCGPGAPERACHPDCPTLGRVRQVLATPVEEEPDTYREWQEVEFRDGTPAGWLHLTRKRIGGTVVEAQGPYPEPFDTLSHGPNGAPAGSPDRMSYADAPPQEWKEGERVEVTRDLGIDPFRVETGAAYPIPAGTRGNVRFDSLHSCPVLFDGFDEVQDVPTSWLRRV